MMDRGIRVTRLDQAPDFSKFTRGGDDEAPRRDGPRMDKPWKGKKSGDGDAAERPRREKPFRERPSGEAPARDWKPKGRSADAPRDMRSVDDEVWGEPTPKASFGKGKPARGGDTAGQPQKKGAGKSFGDKPFKGKAAGKDTAGRPFGSKGKAGGGPKKFGKGNDRAR
jgi:ATP-dependent RNA helicase DeaD